MADHEHLRLHRIERPPQARQRQPSRFRPPVQYPDRRSHARTLTRHALAIVEEFENRQAEATGDIQPKLLLNFELNRKTLPEEEFARAGLHLLDSGSPRHATVYAPDPDLRALRRRLDRYALGERPHAPADPEQRPRAAQYEGFFDAVDGYRPMQPIDRLSRRLQEQLTVAGMDEQLMFDVELFFPAESSRREDWLIEVRDEIERLDADLIDEYVGRQSGVILLRVSGNAAVVHALADLDQVAMIDGVAEPDLDDAEIADLQDADVLPDEPPVPDPSAPLVGLIDSGVRAGHPLLEGAMYEAVALHPAFGGQSEDQNGHGTRVAGRILYGDILKAARNGEFDPVAWLASVRILGADGRAPAGASELRLVTQAVRHLARLGVRIINLSFGDAGAPYVSGRSSALSAVLDTLARRHRLVLITTTGNVRYADLAPQAQMFARWPDYLLDAGHELLNPSQAALALTVGAIAERDAPSGGAGTAAAGRSRGPAPFSRRGLGIGDAPKPELVADGGNWVYDRGNGQQLRDNAVGVLSTSARYPSELFDISAGTSMAAPYITHLAARLLGAHPHLQSNTVRALLLQAARHDPSRLGLWPGESPGERRLRLQRLSGFGEVEWERCGVSQDNRVVMYAEDGLLPDAFHVYRLPLTDAWHDEPGPRSLTVALAFETRVRHRRLDYMACKSEFMLVSDMTEQQVFDAASADVADTDAAELSAHKLDTHPARTRISPGANQMARYELRTRSRALSGCDEVYLVVRNLDRWLGSTAEAQPYSVAVAYEVERADSLYAELRAALQAQLRARTRLQVRR